MSGSAEILVALRELANTKQIDRTELHELLRDGILAALAKKHGPTVQAEVEIDDDKGAIRIVMLKKVVETVEDGVTEIALEEARYEDPDYQPGDLMEIPVEFAEFGRSAVQACKQRIVQRVREGERTKIRDEFSSRVGDLLSGEIQQIERGKIVLLLNKFREAEAIIPYREQNHRETYSQGEPIRAVLKRIEETPKGPRLILSRADALFVQALFRLEVPEIQAGVVEIRAASREVGSRTKIAVVSRDDGIDPVGACVGLKGARVQAVVQELGGERIDIVPWSADPERFAKLRSRRRRSPASSARRRPRRSRPSSTRISSRSRSGGTARTSAWRRSSRGGRSTSTRAGSGWSAAVTSRSSRRSRTRPPPTCCSPRSWGSPRRRSRCSRRAGTAR